MRQSKVDLRAANNARMDVVGVVNAAISSVRRAVQNHKQDLRGTKRGLRTVNKFFPAAKAGNQHGAKPETWDRTGTVADQLPNASYNVKVNGRTSKRTPQHLRQFDPCDMQVPYPAAQQITFDDPPPPPPQDQAALHLPQDQHPQQRLEETSKTTPEDANRR